MKGYSQWKLDQSISGKSLETAPSLPQDSLLGTTLFSPYLYIFSKCWQPWNSWSRKGNYEKSDEVSLAVVIIVFEETLFVVETLDKYNHNKRNCGSIDNGSGGSLNAPSSWRDAILIRSIWGAVAKKASLMQLDALSPSMQRKSLQPLFPFLKADLTKAKSFHSS